MQKFAFAAAKIQHPQTPLLHLAPVGHQGIDVGKFEGLVMGGVREAHGNAFLISTAWPLRL